MSVTGLDLTRWRIVGWSVAGAGALAVGVGLSSSERWAEQAVGLATLAGFVVGLGMEALGLVLGQIRGESGRPPVPPGARLADGVVDVLAMADVSCDAATDHAPWSRFAALAAPGAAAIAPRPMADRSGAGNPPLLGTVALISVFVGRDGQSWSEREILAAHRSLEAVGRWAEREAARRSIPLNLGLAAVYFQAEDPHDAAVVLDFRPEGDDFGPMEADATTKSVAGASRVAASLGFADVADLVGRINPRIEADAHVWLWHLKQRGRSHAIPAGDRVGPGVGLAVCYAREASFPEPLRGPGRVDPTTVAHELFHLFGASDKYGVASDRFQPGSVPRSDIMRLAEDRLDRLRVGRLTAIEVGWPVA